MSHGKNYRNARATFDREQEYSPVQAIRLLKDMQTSKFDETVEVHFRLGLNVRHADEQLRGTLMLPHGTGKSVRVAVFAEGEKAKEAQDAGADVVGSADLAKRVEEGFTDFDVAIATPDQMGNVGRLGRILGPRGLMPNPKTGTVTMDDRAREARCREGPLHPADHAGEYDGPRHSRRPAANARDRGRVGGRGSSSSRVTPVAEDRKQPRGRSLPEADRRNEVHLVFSSPPVRGLVSFEEVGR